MAAARKGGRAGVVLLVAAACCVSGVDALAVWQASTAGSSTATTGTWSAVATQAAAAPWGSGSLVLTGVRRTSPGYFSVVNTGTLPLTSATYQVTAPAPVALEVCDTGWDTRRGRCTGTVTALAQGVATSVVPAAPGDALSVRASTTGNAKVDVGVDVLVPRAGARSPVTATS